MNAGERLRLAGAGRTQADRLRAARMPKAARALEGLIKKEEFTAVDEVLDASADFERAMASVRETIGLSSSQVADLKKQILEAGQ